MDEAVYESPLGSLRICANEHGVCSIRFLSSKEKKRSARTPQSPPKNAHLASALRELSRYFEGTLARFTTPLAPEGTAFQQRVWEELKSLPCKSPVSYGEIARRIGSPQACRAVGQANNRNPIPIMIPCHRVIGKRGQLVGYAGELWRKQWLLAHEAGEGPREDS